MVEKKKQNLQEQLDEFMRGFQVITLDVGDDVICDTCGEHWTDSDVSGGITFGSKAVCPTCAPEVEKLAKEHGEEGYIQWRCPKTVSFADWVRDFLREPREDA